MILIHVIYIVAMATTTSNTNRQGTTINIKIRASIITLAMNIDRLKNEGSR